MSVEDWIFAALLMAATLVRSLVMSWIVVVALYRVQAADATPDWWHFEPPRVERAAL